MQSINNYSPNFGSVHIPNLPSVKNMPITKPLDLVHPYFELKGFWRESPQQVREMINLSQAGVTFHNGQLTIVGKDREADEFIARQFAKSDIPHKYVQDTPETKFEGPVFDLSV